MILFTDFICLEYSTLENLAEVILESGINEPNFRYTGARQNFHL